MASDPTSPSIGLPILMWARILRELRRRGEGRRESGAFLLGPPLGSPRRVTSFVCYDDLDPAACESGAIAFHADGYAALWERCRKKKLEVIGDVHTHPGAHVGQSGIDRRNPMVPVVGHTAVIVPNFGRAPWWSLETAGVYVYLGNFEWRAHTRPARRHGLRLVLW